MVTAVFGLCLQSLYPADIGGSATLSPDGCGPPRPEGISPPESTRFCLVLFIISVPSVMSYLLTYVDLISCPFSLRICCWHPSPKEPLWNWLILALQLRWRETSRPGLVRPSFSCRITLAHPDNVHIVLCVYRFCWDSRLPLSWGSEEGSIRESCRPLGLWSDSFLLYFFFYLLPYFLANFCFLSLTVPQVWFSTSYWSVTHLSGMKINIGSISRSKLELMM